jgi:Fe-S-cluster containining protein
MVAGCRTNKRLLEKVAEIYTWLNAQIRDNNKLTGQCKACGKCCDFGNPDQGPAPAFEQGFDHRLFVTPPELMYLTTGQQAANLGAENIKLMPTNRCPYNIDGKCTVYEYRFASCRIFYCKADVDFQGELSESALKKLKSLCTEFQIPYHYTDLATALNTRKSGPKRKTIY